MIAELNNLPKGNFVAGEWRTAGTETALDVRNKYTGEIIASLPYATASDMEAAIAAAAQAMPKLAQLTAAHLSCGLETLWLRLWPLCAVAN